MISANFKPAMIRDPIPSVAASNIFIYHSFFGLFPEFGSELDKLLEKRGWRTFARGFDSV
jgi:hypothetical protein